MRINDGGGLETVVVYRPQAIVIGDTRLATRHVSVGDKITRRNQTISVNNTKGEKLEGGRGGEDIKPEMALISESLIVTSFLSQSHLLAGMTETEDEKRRMQKRKKKRKKRSRERQTCQLKTVIPEEEMTTTNPAPSKD
jgi:hypothetical protein